MTLVQADERVITRDRHHRRPRAPMSSWQRMRWLEDVTYPTGNAIVEPPPADRPDTPLTWPPGGKDVVDLYYWSVADGPASHVQGGDIFRDAASAVATTQISAWYGPPFSGGPVRQPGSGVMIDAFSTLAGDFIDDDFVVVADASLTAGANENGWVPTDAVETLQATETIGVLAFDHWLAFGPIITPAAGSDELDLAAGTDGMAIAVYGPGPLLNPPPTYRLVPQSIRDAAVLTALAHNPPDGPIGAVLGRLAANAAIREETTLLSPELIPKLMQTLDDDATDALTKAIEALHKG